ncbi:MAG: hypothetical protein HHAS10_02240 [Candidatus Altimarinota bacterium]
MFKAYLTLITPLQYFLVISGVIITVVALALAKRERFNALHFLVFLAGGVGLLVFGFFPGILDQFAKFVGVAKGADALVYGSVVFLFYFSLLLLAKIESQREELTRLVRELALHDIHAKK